MVVNVDEDFILLANFLDDEQQLVDVVRIPQRFQPLQTIQGGVQIRRHLAFPGNVAFEVRELDGVLGLRLVSFDRLQ